MLDLKKYIEELRSKRPVFHSEADFQHALAWVIHEGNKEAKVRLEFPFDGNEGRQYLDILVSEGKEEYAIELKYKTKKFYKEIGRDKFDLTNQSAHDWGCWGFCKDIERIRKFGGGFAVFLTNDKLYWTEPRGTGRPNYSAFKLFQGQELKGELEWINQNAKSLKNNMKRSVKVGGPYKLEWNDYSSYGFRYLLVNVM